MNRAKRDSPVYMHLPLHRENLVSFTREWERSLCFWCGIRKVNHLGYSHKDLCFHVDTLLDIVLLIVQATFNLKRKHNPRLSIRLDRASRDSPRTKVLSEIWQDIK